jgi:hypothetical protein
LILSAEAANRQVEAAYVVLAHGKKEEVDWGAYRLHAVPSFDHEGEKFFLEKESPQLLHDDGLPDAFNDMAETRLLISNTLRREVFQDQADFWSFRLVVPEKVSYKHLRHVDGQPRSTLFDLHLTRGDRVVSVVRHALCLRPHAAEVRFIHLTDLHVAARNDMWGQEVNQLVHSAPGAAPLQFINFNDRLRRFVKYANEQADKGEVDFVLMLGDLVDFVQPGFGEPDPDANNWHAVRDILLGTPSSGGATEPGLRVPIFTTTGNHDWRPFPYPPEVSAGLFGLTKKQAEKLDYLYSDTSNVIGEKIQSVYSKLVAEGSPILARSWWHSIVGPGLRRLQVALEHLTTRIATFEGKLLKKIIPILLAMFLGEGERVEHHLLSLRDPLWSSMTDSQIKFTLTLVLILSLLGYLFWNFRVRDWMGDFLRHKIESLIAIESSVEGLRDYLLNFNPYFNYAFRLGKCYFLVLETGHDCLTAQSFWDNGGKKVNRVTVSDNIIGGSPDTMGFFPANPHFHYSQITWLETALKRIAKENDEQRVGQARRCRIFVGVHAPPANLSPYDRRRADRGLSRSTTGALLLPKRPWLLGGYDVCYGSINHYLSEFYYLCLGYTQSDQSESSGPGIDAVFAGHAHWCVEFKLRGRPEGKTGGPWKPRVYYGKFSQEVEKDPNPPDAWWGPLLLQTAACGPPSLTDSHTPYFRLVTVDRNLGVTTLAQRQLS